MIRISPTYVKLTEITENIHSEILTFIFLVNDDFFSSNHWISCLIISYFILVEDVTSAQYCCLVSESMWAKPPRTSAFISDLCTELDSRWSGGLRLANCFARFHQLSHWTTMFALTSQRLLVRLCCVSSNHSTKTSALMIFTQDSESKWSWNS